MKKTFYIRNTRAGRTLAKQLLKANQIVILFSAVVTIRRAIASLGMPKGNSERGVKAKEIIDACEVSTYVAIPAPAILALRTLLTNYNGATAATRVNLYNLLCNGLTAVMFTFQNAANANAAEANAILLSGKFKVRIITIRQHQQFEATNTAISGTVLITAEGGGGHTCHDWFYSADGVAFERMQPTVAAETHKDGLLPTKYAYFMHQLIDKTGSTGMSGIIKVLVE